MQNTKINYQKILDQILKEITLKETFVQNKPKLLLHACCAPCSSYVIEYLSTYFDITIYYFNPNIYPQKEYERRLNELENFLQIFPYSIKLIKDIYNQDIFYSAIDIKNNPQLATEKEKGVRCYNCYKFRMKKSYEYAINNNFDYFTTTLSISPFKDSTMINTIGKELEEEFSKDNKIIKTKFLTSDFKKKNGFKRSLELSSEYNLYRQQYCGCIYSKNNTHN